MPKIILKFKIFVFIFLLTNFIGGFSSLALGKTAQPEKSQPYGNQIITLKEAAEKQRTFFETCHVCLAPEKSFSGPQAEALNYLAEASTANGRQLFVIIDGAQQPELVQALLKSKKSLEYSSLFAETFFKELKVEAPYLVQIRAQDSFLQEIFKTHEKNKKPILFFTSFYGLKNLHQHIQKMMLAKIPNENKIYNFRIYDPNVLQALFLASSEQEQASIMGPIDQALIWQADQQSWSNLNNPQNYGILINEKQFKAFEGLSIDQFYGRMADYIEEKLPEQYQSLGRQRVLEIFKQAYHLGKKYGLITEREIYQLGYLMLKFGENISQNPFVIQTLKNKELGNYEKIENLYKKFGINLEN